MLVFLARLTSLFLIQCHSWKDRRVCCDTCTTFSLLRGEGGVNRDVMGITNKNKRKKKKKKKAHTVFALMHLSSTLTQRSRESPCVWAVEVRYTTSTSWESPRTWSGTQPASSVQSAASIWTRPALVSSETGRLTVKETMQGRKLGVGGKETCRMCCLKKKKKREEVK